MKDWSKNGIDFNLYCNNEIEIKDLATTTMGCAGRDLSLLYTFTSGFACQCDSLCEFFGDCCSDFNEEAKEVITDFPDRRVYCMPTETPKHVKLAGVGFYLIASCLNDYLHHSVVSGCLAPSRDNIDIRMYMPVSVNGLAYRNAYCALCNNEPVSQFQFWHYVRSGKTWNICDDYLTAVRRNLSDTQFVEDPLCDVYGVFYPPNEALSGRTRMGKYCSMQKRNIFKGHHQAITIVNSYPTYILMQPNRIEVIDAKCFCKFCKKSIYPYLTSATNQIVKYLSSYSGPLFFTDFPQGVVWENFVHNGALANIFHQQELGFSVQSENDALNINATKERTTFVVLSLAGSGSSTVFILAILLHMFFTNGFNTKPRRCQIGIFVGKLIFYFAHCCGTFFKDINVLCKIFAVSVHYGMLASFIHMIWFGIKVSRMIWELNHNMAILHNERQKQKMDVSEVLILLGIWLGSFSFVIGLWAYEQYIDDSLVSYGQKEVCHLTGKMGRLYFVAVPAGIMVILNTGSILFSTCQFIKLFDEKKSQIVWKQFVIFLGKLVVLQSLQWIFGIVYYFTSSTTVGHIFELLVAFEGAFMAISYFFSYLIKYITVIWKILFPLS